MSSLAHGSPPAPGLACGACGAALETGQEYCLECGSRLTYRRGPLAALGRSWERRFGRYPGDWLWISLLALGLAAGGAAAAIALTDDGARRAGETIVATSTPPRVTAPVTTVAPPTATAQLPTTPKPRPKPVPKPKLLASWPVDHGYTVVLASIPARGTGRAEAQAKAKAALARELEQVGILVSDNFASLHPGYYVVFAGVYETLDDAQVAARRLRSRYPAAYEREITR